MYKFHKKNECHIIFVICFGGSWRFYQWVCMLGMGALWSGTSYERLQLSNSGNILKPLVLNDDLKVVRGWNNFLVIIQRILEKGMDNRGSKSIVALVRSTIVKEQRVDGSWQEKFFFHPFTLGGFSCLRCTLVGFERNHQIRILSNQINMCRNYGSKAVVQ